MTRDLISREAAIKTLVEHFAKKIMEFGHKSYEEADTMEKMYCDGVSDAMNIVDTLPSADRPTAKWTTNKLGYFECTACETMLFMKQRDWRFCPYCGAVLEGEDE